MQYIGLDYHQTTSTLHILDANGKAVNQRSIRGGWEKVVTYLQRHAERCGEAITICYEASCGYGHLYDQLRKFTRRVIVANPNHLRLIFRSKRKNDRVDAQKLAKLAYLDHVPAVHVPSKAIREWRHLIETRQAEVRARTRMKNRLRALLRMNGLRGPAGKKLWTIQGMQWLEELELESEMQNLERDLLVDGVREADRRIARIEGLLNKMAARHNGVQLLQTMPGVGPRTAETIVAYVDDPHRFSRIKKIGSYFGIVPCEDSSADRRRLGHITKQGPATARKLIIEATWQAIRKSSTVQAYFERIMGDKPERKKIALVATGHYLLRVMLSMLKSGEVWHETAPAAIERPD